MTTGSVRFIVGVLAVFWGLGAVGCSSAPRTYTQKGSGGAQGAIKVSCYQDGGHAIPAANRTVTITKLDGEKLTSVASDVFFNGPAAPAGGVEVVYVNPGRHEMGLHWKQGGSYSNSAVWFVAETGKEYLVQWKDADKAVQFWVEEVGSGKHVGGKLEG